MRKIILYSLVLFFIASCNCGPLLQRTTITYDATHHDSAWIQLPCSYNHSSDTAHYSLLVFFHGTGEAANDGNLSVMLTLGPPKYMADSIRYLFYVNKVFYHTIVLCPQDNDGYRSPSNINAILDYMVSHYRIDVSRIYLTGLSAGGRNVLNYLTENQAYANRIAAAIPMSVIYMDAAHEGHFNYVANANVHTRIYCGSGDVSFYANNQRYIDSINHYSPGLGELVSYAGGHCCWNQPYSPRHDYYDPNMYEWMLQFHR